MARFTTPLPDHLVVQAKDIAKKNSSNLSNTVRTLITLGLFLVKQSQDPNKEIVVKEGDKETVVVSL